MPHFTYVDEPCKDYLKQGDILLKTPEIEAALHSIHPYYIKPDYKYYIVLTQSCDLILRKSAPCKAKYITLAAVRTLEQLLEREISKYQQTEVEIKGKLCDKNKRDYLQKFLERLFNNNEPEYFYLHEDSSKGLSGSYVAFLRLAVSLKSSVHYKTCLDAKILELDEIFQAKLGWLVGNMYSRVGTPDWTPDTMSEEQFEDMIDGILGKNILWIDRAIIKEIKRKLVGASELSEEQIREIMAQISIPSKEDVFFKTFETMLNKRKNTELQEQSIKELILQIKNDPVISSILK